MGRIPLFPLLFQNRCSQSSRFLPQARRIVGSKDKNGVEFERLRHREILEISPRMDKKLYGATLRNIQQLDPYPKGLWVNSPRGVAEWAIDPWPLRAKGLIVLVSPN